MDFADQALKMAGALGVVVTLLLGGTFLLKRFMGENPTHLGQSILRLVGGLRLGQGKAIMLVEVAGEVLVIGSTTRDLTLLTRVTDTARVEQLRETSSQAVGGLGLLSTNLWRRADNVATMIQKKSESV
ncbi:MAG: flagellar biosynthetic protein FliO [Nitrospirales bacterium]